MIRIQVKWDFISPVLQVVSGRLEIHDINFNKKPMNKLLLECKVKVERHSTGFSSIDNKGIPFNLFEKLKPEIDIMIKSFYHGVLLRHNSYCWIEDSSDKTFNEWAEEKGFKKGIDYD